MTKTVFAFALAVAAATPALAQPEQLRFSRDGHDYVAHILQKDGYQIITGRDATTGEPFRLRVANGRVRGDFAGRQVAFAGSLPQTEAVAAAD